jgi:hypothetical protein
MSQTHAAMQSGSADADVADGHHVSDPHGEDDNGCPDNRGRRWYHLRPEPRRRSDLMGFNSTWWMALGWLILILLVVFPFPFWSW